MDTTGITPVMNVGGNDGMFGGNGFMGIFGLLILVGLLNGGFGGFGGGQQQYAHGTRCRTDSTRRTCRCKRAGS